MSSSIYEYQIPIEEELQIYRKEYLGKRFIHKNVDDVVYEIVNIKQIYPNINLSDHHYYQIVADVISAPKEVSIPYYFDMADFDEGRAIILNNLGEELWK